MGSTNLGGDCRASLELIFPRWSKREADSQARRYSHSEEPGSHLPSKDVLSSHPHLVKDWRPVRQVRVRPHVSGVGLLPHQLVKFVSGAGISPENDAARATGTVATRSISATRSLVSHCRLVETDVVCDGVGLTLTGTIDMRTFGSYTSVISYKNCPPILE